MLLPSRFDFSGVAHACNGCADSGCMLLLLLLLFSCVLARDATESRDGDGSAEPCDRACECARATALGGGAFTCKDDDVDAPKLLPLAFEDALKFADRPRRLGRGLVPCLLPGAAVPGADTALKWENPRRRRGWPAEVLQ
jgi:hypothetical protein